jgi:hypothetical protein
MNVHSHETPQMWPQSGGTATKALGGSVESPSAPYFFGFAGFSAKNQCSRFFASALLKRRS